MDFMPLIQSNFDKLNDFTVITNLWQEIMDGGVSELTLEQITQYSFHYPVDTEVYLEELNRLFDNCQKEELRTIDGKLKAYLVTFLYYCICSTDRVSLKTSLNAAILYVKIISLPSGLGQIYFEKNVYKAMLQICINGAKDKELLSKDLLHMIYNYAAENQLDINLVRSTSNMFAIIIMYTGKGNMLDITQVSHMSSFSFDCLKKIIMENDEPKHVKIAMESVLRFLRKKPFENVSNERRKTTANLFKIFISNLLKDLESSKVQYLLDAFFVTWGKTDFDSFEDTVIVLNMMERKFYKELLRKLPYYLISKNHKKYYINLMILVYEMMANLPPFEDEKLDVFFSCCLKNILMHVLNKNKITQDKAIDVLSKIFLLNENIIVRKILELCRTTGKFATISPNAILKAFCHITEEKFGGSSRSKNIVIIVSKLLIYADAVEAELSSKIIDIICKDCTPFTLKPLLPFLHELYLNMSLRREQHICQQILRIFVKNALHQDTTSSYFQEHLYTCLIYNSSINGVEYPSEYYSNLFLTDDFEYKMFFNKCSRLIKYQHVYNTIANFDFRKPGHSVLLNCLLDVICYKETNVILDYIVDNFAELCIIENAGIVFQSFVKILRNRKTFNNDEIPKLDVLYGLMWDALYQQHFVVCNLKASFELIDVLREILKLQENKEKETLLNKISEDAYNALTRRNYSGAVMYLTELCLVMGKMPDQKVLELFETIMQTPETINLLKLHSKDCLIQMLTFFTTIAIMNRKKIPLAVSLLTENLESDNMVIKITALKLLYTICTEVTHEFEDVIKFVFQKVSDKDPCLCRICIIIIEELIHENYVLLTSEDFLKLVYHLGCQELHFFMQNVLENRFVLSNKNDIGRYYICTMVYISGYTKFDNYPVPSDFIEELIRIRAQVDCPNDIFSYLFNSLPVKTKFNILKEIASIFDKLMMGQFKIDDSFFQFLSYCVLTFKVMSSKGDTHLSKSYYSQICKQIETQILTKDSKYKDPSFYGEFENDIKNCTLVLLKLLFYIEDDRIMKQLRFDLFDATIHWIDHMKPEIVHYVHKERGTDYNMHLSKLMAYFKTNKDYLESLAIDQER